MHDDCPCQHHTLALTAGKFVRVAVKKVRRESNRGHEIGRFHSAFGRIALGEDQQRFGHLFNHRQAAVQCAQRILINHLHATTQMAPTRIALGWHRFAFKMHLATARLQQAQHQSGSGRFTAARLTHQTQRFPWRE